MGTTRGDERTGGRGALLLSLAALALLARLAGAGCWGATDLDGDADRDAALDEDGDADQDRDREVDAEADGDAAGADAEGEADADGDEGRDGEADGCVPDCSLRRCGPDPVCGVECGPGCGAGELCTEAGRCVARAPGVWVTVPAGTFWMGSPEGELGRWSRETLHEVTLTRSFEIWSTEVTRAELVALMGFDPSLAPACGADCPAGDLLWREAAACCNALSDAASLPRCYQCPGRTCAPSPDYATPYDCPGYRLPTEAEWEYAARAGTRAATHAGDLDGTECSAPVLDPIAWYCGNSHVTYADAWDCSSWGGSPTCGVQPVATLEANPWGLFDVHGNVREWCHDWYQEDLGAEPATDPWGPATGSGHVHRGGGAGSHARTTRAAARFGLDPAETWGDLGFRPVRTLP